ncbi:hypothetical protein B0T20DRAFT_397341 [Sordaria brevicollis]|uniref:Uncharacterized protein n=1 Tax=Sordaria brevicollis TaxID=83679 RepID=A0AAE0NWN3_SORBR|nr:hypothetical protein B0T20DRAFT_397341 [Sordaria brevicollis]
MYQASGRLGFTLNSNYAGVCQAFLPPPKPELKHDLASHFPSWSWAACADQICFPTINEFEETRRLAKLESIHGTDDNTTDPLGPARIILRGALICFINAKTILADGSRKPVVRWKDEVPVKESSIWIRVTTTFRLDQPIDAEAKPKKLELLPLYYDCLHGAMQMSGNIHGLILEPVGDRDGLPLYRRLGGFESQRNIFRGRQQESFWAEGLTDSGGLQPWDAFLSERYRFIEVEGSDGLNYENGELDKIFDMADKEDAVDGIPKELYEELWKKRLICLV